jgi:regulator of RNase E activity RraA
MGLFPGSGSIECELHKNKIGEEVMHMVSMNLDELKNLRDNQELVELSIPENDLLERYEKLYTGAINDVLREFTLVDQALPPAIHPLRDEMTVAGFAFTIKSATDPTISGEMETRAKMLEAIEPNSICVWDTTRDNESAHWGEVMTAASKVKGAKGAVIDGGLRDTWKVLAQDFPVFHRYRTSNGTLARCKITGYQVPIKIGKVIIHPGDVIFGDIDGVIVIPRIVACDVLIRAEEISKNENEIKKWIANGMSPNEVVDKGGYF